LFFENKSRGLPTAIQLYLSAVEMAKNRRSFMGGLLGKFRNRISGVPQPDEHDHQFIRKEVVKAL